MVGTKCTVRLTAVIATRTHVVRAIGLFPTTLAILLMFMYRMDDFGPEVASSGVASINALIDSLYGNEYSACSMLRDQFAGTAIHSHLMRGTVCFLHAAALY
jgi:hypothetical protein